MNVDNEHQGSAQNTGDVNTGGQGQQSQNSDKPDSHLPRNHPDSSNSGNSSAFSVLLVGLGVFLIVVGVLVLLPMAIGPFWQPFRATINLLGALFWPILLITAGVFVVFLARSTARRREEPPLGRPSMPPQGTRLMRSSRNRMIGGVCGGIGEYFNIDPTLIRIIVVVLALLPAGPMVLVYIVAWIIIPLDRR